MPPRSDVIPFEFRMAKALGHPLRQRLLQRYSEGVHSPSDLAHELRATLGDVSYHTRRLLDLGWLEEVRTEQVRGATKHFYRAQRVSLDDDLIGRMAPAARRTIFAGIVRQILIDAGDGAEAPNGHVSRTVVTLDDDGVRALTALLATTVERIAEIERASEARGGGDRMWEAALLGFPLLGDQPQSAGTGV